MLKRKVIVGVVALAAVALAGGAYAATQDSSSPRQAFLNDVAKRLHVTPQQLQAALRGAYADRLQSLVAAGRLTQAQANKLEQRIARGQLPPFFGGRRFGPPRLGGPRELSAAASYLGLTDAQLLNQLGSGKSLAQIARGRGKSVSGLKSTMEAAIRTRLDRLVSRGVITNAQEQQILSRMSAMLGALINRSGRRGVDRVTARRVGSATADGSEFLSSPTEPKTLGAHFLRGSEAPLTTS